jgi:hypothetical protein
MEVIMLDKKIKIIERTIFFIVIAIGLLISSPVYSAADKGRGAQRNDSSGQASASARTAPAATQPQQSSQPRQQEASMTTTRVETSSPQVSRQQTIQQNNQRVSVQPQQPRSTTSVNTNTHSVSQNPAVSVRRSTNTPTVTVSPPASARSNTQTASVESPTRASVNRSVALPSITTASRAGRNADSQKVAAASANTSVTISTEKTSRIGRTVGNEKNTSPAVIRRERQADSDAAKTNQPQDNTSARNSQLVQHDKIGSVIGKTSPDKQTADRTNRAEDRRIARETGDRSVSIDKDAATRNILPLPRKDDARRDTPQRTIQPVKRDNSPDTAKQIDRKNSDRQSDRVLKSNVRELTRPIGRSIIEKRVEFRGNRSSRTIIYHDRPRDFSHFDHYDHIYRDYHNNFCHIAIWPRYHYWVNYNSGFGWTFTYVHPFYHRKYLFVSLGGWWPTDYSYMRYYWYNYHPYEWYGYYPVPQEVYTGSTNNYYTYNYYNNTADDTAQTTYVDQSTFADVRAKLQQQAENAPAAATLADTYFDEAVKAFENNCFNLAADKFAQAMKLAPDDMILPFAYAQSLMALEKYTDVAEVLRIALVKVTPEKEGVFYPRGLYADEDILTSQLNLLIEKAKLYPYDTDLQLILGYQLLGLGELDEAEQPLTIASQDIRNAPAANVLLNLLAKMRARTQTSLDTSAQPVLADAVETQLNVIQ